MTKDGSKDRLGQETEFDGFLEGFGKNVLVTFGTTHMPSRELCILLVQTFEHFSNVGFVVSLKDNDEF